MRREACAMIGGNGHPQWPCGAGGCSLSARTALPISQTARINYRGARFEIRALPANGTVAHTTYLKASLFEQRIHARANKKTT